MLISEHIIDMIDINILLCGLVNEKEIKHEK